MTDTVTIPGEQLQRMVNAIDMLIPTLGGLRDSGNRWLRKEIIESKDALRAALDATCQDSRQVAGCVDTDMQAATVLGLQPVAWVDGRWYEDGTRADNTLVWTGRRAENDFPVGTQFYTSPQPTAQPSSAVPEVDDAPIPPDSMELKQKPRKAVKLTHHQVIECHPVLYGLDDDTIEFAENIEAAVLKANGVTE